jgi:hypothetical protein
MRTRESVLFVSKLAAALFLLAQTCVWSQDIRHAESDGEIIARMNLSELALSILSVRTDLREYAVADLNTTSGQYELLYDESMGSCSGDETRQPCEGTSINVSFFRYVKSNQRICRDPDTGSCWKPALTEAQMREELTELVKKMRLARSSRVGSREQ